jgi:hypothetical protein
MKKFMVLFLVLVLALISVAPVYSGDRSHGDRHYQGERRHYHNGGDFLSGFIAGAFSEAFVGSLAPRPYPPAYNPYPPVYRSCTRKVIYGYWAQDYYGRPHWVTTRVDYVPAPCQY